MNLVSILRRLVSIGVVWSFTGCATVRLSSQGSWPHYTLRAERTVLLNLPRGERFDASGLLLTPSGDLLTVSDAGAALYRIQLQPGKKEADLAEVPGCFTTSQLAPLAREKIGRYDCEGIAQDERGRIYLCEEANRWVLRCDPRTHIVERLDIDWSPVKAYFSKTDSNASFEGIAVAGGRLYLANERNEGRIIVVELTSLKVIDDFVVRPSWRTGGDMQYSDLCWFDGALFVLCRQDRVVLKVDPAKRQVLAEYDYREMESDPEMAYLSTFLIGSMEGLAVDANHFWLVTDNNGIGHTRRLSDIRPTLFQCSRPDKD